jgi:hypothetical protein
MLARFIDWRNTSKRFRSSGPAAVTFDAIVGDASVLHCRSRECAEITYRMTVLAGFSGAISGNMISRILNDNTHVLHTAVMTIGAFVDYTGVLHRSSGECTKVVD